MAGRVEVMAKADGTVRERMRAERPARKERGWIKRRIW